MVYRAKISIKKNVFEKEIKPLKVKNNRVQNTRTIPLTNNIPRPYKSKIDTKAVEIKVKPEKTVQTPIKLNTGNSSVTVNTNTNSSPKKLNNDIDISKIINAFDDLEIWKYTKPKTTYLYNKKKIHLIHWWFKDRKTLELNDLEKFHFSMLWLSDFDNKFDEIYFNIALDKDTIEVRKFVSDSIKDLTKDGNAKINIEFIKNDKNGEFNTWIKMFDFIGKNEGIVFYSHFKGVNHNDPYKIINIKYWCYLMYQGCLIDGWNTAMKTLEDSYSYGSISSCGGTTFEKRMDSIKDALNIDCIKNDGIHYVGTFYFWNTELYNKYFVQNNIKLTKSKLLNIKNIPTRILCEVLSSCIVGETKAFLGRREDAKITNVYEMYSCNKYDNYIEKFRNLYKDNNKSKNICYTVITNGYDDLKNPQVISSKCKYICFTDSDLKSYIWEIHKIPEELNKISKKKQSRIIKVLPQKFLPEHEWSMYIDGNITINTDPAYFISDVCNNMEFSIPTHFSRNCIYEESKAVIKSKIDTADTVNKQIEKYRKEGFPEEYGLNENNLLVRKNIDSVNKVNEMWANEILNGSYRDQLSLRYCLWKFNLKINNLPSTIVRESKYFIYHKHKK